MRLIFHITILVATVAGCAANVYELPPPPDETERSSVDLNPASSDEADAESFMEARRAILSLAGALGNEDWEDAYGLVSSETRILLDTYGDGRGEDLLARGQLVGTDGNTYQFEPLSLFLLSEIASIEDSMDGVEEAESSRRKDVFLVAPDDSYRRVVVIREGEQWLVHMRELPTDRMILVEPDP